MRGKKADQDFIAKFISECAINGKNTPNQILTEAELQISKIDEEILKVEKLKKIRSKLYDVVFLFKEKESNNNLNINFNIVLAKEIFSKIEKGNYNLPKIIKDEELCLLIKQLVELKIINRNGTELVKGEKFKEFNQGLNKC